MTDKKASLKVTLVKGMSQVPRDQRECLTGLGLRKIRQSVMRQDTPSVRGLILRVRHLVDVESVD